MSIFVYITDNSNIAVETSSISCFGENEICRLENIKNYDHKKESYAALLALKKLADMLLPSFADLTILRNEDGRPYFCNMCGVDFNFSHSASLSVSAIIDGEGKKIGVDIERLYPNRFCDDAKRVRKIADRFFSENEKKLLGEEKFLMNFYKIWTSKEALSKYLGGGLSKELPLLDTTLDKTMKEIMLKSFLLSFGEERYIMTVCAPKGEKIEFTCDKGIEVKSLERG